MTKFSNWRIAALGAVVLGAWLTTSTFAADESPTTAEAPVEVTEASEKAAPEALPEALGGSCKTEIAAQAGTPFAVGQAIICVCDTDADCSADDLCGKEGGICEITTPCEKDPRGSCFCGKTRTKPVQPIGL